VLLVTGAGETREFMSTSFVNPSSIVATGGLLASLVVAVPGQSSSFDELLPLVLENLFIYYILLEIRIKYYILSFGKRRGNPFDTFVDC
jgi:hypothetical protein